jgi:anti-sigma regulatory factor (Ser/Thr protein kinase)
MSCEHLLAADHPVPREHGRMSRHIHLSPVLTAPKEARSFVRSTAQVLDAERLHDLLVLTSELATNAVLHARTPFEVSVTVTDDVVLVCVADRMTGQPRSPVQSDGSEDGRGMVLVRSLADEWGVSPALGPVGKAVWFLFRRGTAEDQAAGVEGQVGARG